MPTFSLDREPWIPVMRQDGRTELVDLKQVFAEAEQLVGVGGSPVEAAALTRFLLGIVHLVDTPISLEEWRTLWKNRASLMSRCADYVVTQGDVWDLFHPDEPFAQVAGQDRTINPAHILVYEAARKNNPVHADHRLVEKPGPVAPDALARGLIAANAFAGSSGGGYLSGPLCMRTVASLVGRNLSETLLLNLLVQKSKPAAFDWRSFGKTPAPSPLDVTRRYLWCSRRVRLIRADNGDTTQIALSPGDGMADDLRKEDPMIPYRLDSQGKDYVPLRLEPNRALWRSAHVILNWHEDVKRLAAVDQLHRLVSREHVGQDTKVSLRVWGVSGDAQGPRTDLWRDERLPFSLSVIRSSEMFASVQRAISGAEDGASECRKRIYSFAARYLQNGTEAKPDKSDVGRLADELSKDLYDYWSMLAPQGERVACEDFDEAAWADLLKRASEQTFRNAIDRLPPDARRFRAQFARTSVKEKAIV